MECLEADRDYSSAHTPHRSYPPRQTRGSQQRSLPESDFLRVHRTIIVNRAVIRERRRGRAVIETDAAGFERDFRPAADWSG
jgi:DNA-binding LytR/AlgR family response regulator